MKVAVCISGQPRTAEICVPHIKRFFSNVTPDYYFHMWDKNQWIFHASDLDPTEEELVSTNVIEYVISELSPVAYKIDKHPAPHIFEQSISQLDSFNKSLQLINGLYDVIVKCRFDIIWNPTVKFSLPLLVTPNTLYATHIGKSKDLHNMVNDRFFFGDSNTMYALTNVRDEVMAHPQFNGSKGSMLIFPEGAIYTYCEKHNIQIKLATYDNFQEVIVRKQCAGMDACIDFDEILKVHNNFYL
jgi:hypothetical protein